MSVRVGGIGSLKEVDEHLLEILEKVMEDLKLKISEVRSGGIVPEKLEPIAYKTQLVAGTNYFVNLNIGENEFIHARIYRNLGGDVTVHSVTEIKPENVEIEYF